jgi:signal transduction histidine kinase
VEEVLGLEKTDIAGRTPSDMAWEIVDANGEPIPDDDLPFARVMATGKAVFDYEHGIERPDGSRRWLSINAAPLAADAATGGADGDGERVVSVISDVTDQREHERAIERQNERLEEFASVVSHDLRNPLRVAEGRLELAREAHDSDHLAGVASAHERMDALIDDLLTLARDGAEVGDLESVELAELVRRCAESVEPAGARVRIDVDRSIRADRGRLRQLLENLFRNSVEHGSTTHRSQARGDSVERSSTGSRSKTDDSVERSSTGSRPQAGDGVEHENERVTITVVELDDGFAVEDDGPGIPTDERNEVFEAGFSTSQDGTGFGLSIVERIVHAHGWEIHTTEGAAGGARFEITDVAFASE